ncbi:TPA: prophage tail fiber N-terminal domain-containing protein [Citrobacter braakii]|nr:prophage tail fiber N-terminal domain-containing protein [Citrobacter braakii]
MPVLISGILRDGAGNPVAGRTIQLKAKKTSPTVVVNILSSSITGADGSYRIEAEPGYYNVSILREGLLPVHVGEIYVAPTDGPDTLNAFLDAPKSGDLRPEVMKRFEEMVNRTVALCEEAEQNLDISKKSAKEASDSAGQSAASEKNAADSASESAQSAEKSAESARLAGQHKDSAELSAQAAKDSEDAAAKSAEDAAVTLAGALKTENNLSEIAGAGNEAVAEAHQHLQLGDAAKQNVQSDIYDRTPGIVALPGAFGYGAIFGTTQYFSAASGPAEFLGWVSKTPPGRYCVTQYGGGGGTYNAIIPGVNFQGILEINIAETTNLNIQAIRGRLIEFRGINGDFYKNRVFTNPAPRLIGWENLRPDDALKKLYGRLTGEWGDPDVNSLILAVYHGGLSGGEEITLTRGKVISGSRLGPLTIKASISATGSYAASPQFITISCNTHPLPGSYVSLSGAPTTKTTDGLVGIFMRIA